MKLINIILCIIIILSLIELLPYLITIIFPNICYGCTFIGKTQQYLNETIYLGYISWFAYIILFIYFIYLSNRFKNYILKYGSIFLCLFMIYLPTIPLMNIINIFLGLNYIKNPPFIQDYYNIFPSSVEIERNSSIIISEFKNYSKNNKPSLYTKNESRV